MICNTHRWPIYYDTNMQNQTIAAIATALSNSGIAIIRVSGDDAITIVDRVFKSKSGKRLSDVDSHTLHYGYIIENDTDVIDEVIVSVMRGPHSYTGEDVVEINTHGGVLVTKKVLKCVLKNGVVLAQPGEFSKRAFLNGKMDLSQAEAVMDIIQAENDIATKNGISQLRGDISKKIVDIRNMLMDDISHIEAANDDPEHIIYDVFDFGLDKRVDTICCGLQNLIQSFEKGKIVRNGLNTVILGKPNAGKSSLMNRMLGMDRAIVTDIAGTTRDSLEEGMNLGDFNLNLIDTAGIRETDDKVESLGVERSRNLAEDADLILYVIDSSVELDRSDDEIINLTVGKKMIIIYNKTDLEQAISVDELCKLLSQAGHNEDDYTVLPFSLSNDQDISPIIDKIKELYNLGSIGKSNEVMLTNIRHRDLVDKALVSLNNVREGIEASVPDDMLTIDLMDAYVSLGQIIGQSVDDDLVDAVFSRFCMGK